MFFWCSKFEVAKLFHPCPLLTPLGASLLNKYQVHYKLWNEVRSERMMRCFRYILWFIYLFVSHLYDEFCQFGMNHRPIIPRLASAVINHWSAFCLQKASVCLIDYTPLHKCVLLYAARTTLFLTSLRIVHSLGECRALRKCVQLLSFVQIMLIDDNNHFWIIYGCASWWVLCTDTTKMTQLRPSGKAATSMFDGSRTRLCCDCSSWEQRGGDQSHRCRWWRGPARSVFWQLDFFLRLKLELSIRGHP